jgi:cold shock CspA family protein
VAHRERNRRGYEDDEYPAVNNLRTRYRRAAEELFAPLPVRAPTLAADGAEAVQARVKWYSNEKGFGFCAIIDTGEDVFIPRRAVGDDADLPTGAIVTVRIGPDVKGGAGKLVVIALLAVDRSTATGVSMGPRPPRVEPNRVEIGTLTRKNEAGSGFLTTEWNSTVYVPAMIGRQLEVGDRIECECGDGDRGPLATKLIRKL